MLGNLVPESVWLVSEGEIDALGWLDEPVAVALSLAVALKWVAAHYDATLAALGWEIQRGLCPAECERRVLDLGQTRIVLARWSPIAA